jgi:tryptophanyl-tRNA synthetase
MKKIIVSGIQPTGNLHLGNYLGAIKQWKELQKNPEYKCMFGIMDLHAMTIGCEDLFKIGKSQAIFTKIDHPPKIFNRTNIELLRRETGFSLMTCGINPSTLFVQSSKSKIIEMYWRLACNTSIGQLNRMTQFKEKSDKGNENLGLFSYPVLMAADILALEADLVPVGEDQKQHLELARQLARKHGFKVPEPLISKTCGRIMSLVDPTKKMSKSDSNDNSRINLNDDKEAIRKKIRKATTTNEGCANLEKIYLGCGGKKEILNWENARHAKEVVAEQIIEELKK